MVPRVAPLDLASYPAVVAGVDEVGRGAWFGPVVAAAVLITPDQGEQLRDRGVRDSKQLSAKRRSHYVPEIQAIATDVKIGYATPREIDRRNILQASLAAMARAVQRLTPTPHHCYVDGTFTIPGLTLPQTAIIQGDQQEIAIAAASIIAKVWRDRLIERLARRYPQYDLANNKGYGTAKHRLALAEYGVSPLHRRSFKPCQL
ncbi:ribonuclease HII [Spirulina subsalsa]|uniref:ribonuclease HII n=1 Tax=Spirulina TaxID=1154 RepID=UPI003A91D407